MRRRTGRAAALLVPVFLATLVPLTSVHAGTVPAGFVDSLAFGGLENPTVIQFSPDGRVFVGEKSGLIKVFDSLADTSPDTFADLRTNTYNFWDRGLLGLALDPAFPATPYVYALYTYDHILGEAGGAPRWGTVGGTSEGCPNPPGATTNGCVVSARLSRFVASGNAAGPEEVLIEDWCQQYPSHSIGTVAFGPDGALYVSGGDGSNFNTADWGQFGSPLNPCGDAPGGPGDALAPPTAEGGALRSQDVRTLPAGGGGAAYRDLVLADGPASYWRLGEASGTAAADAMGLLGGTYTGGVALGGPGALTGDANTAAGLNGSTGYVAVGDHNRYSLATTGALTVEAWVKAATTPDIWAIVSKGSGNNYEWRLHRTEDTFGLTFWTADGSNRFSLDAPNGLFGSASAWYHVVATVQDGVAAKLYVNGVLRASTTTFAGASGNTASALNIGRRGDNRQYLAGSVDEVAVYDKVLTAAQVAAHYTAGTTGGGGGTTDPTTLDGTILRVNPATGAAMPGNPFSASSDPNAQRIIAYGLRNPFRFAIRPGTEELWVGDVGQSDYEEINRIADINDGVAENFGWPCFEGPGPQSSYDAANLNLCESLYSADTEAAPYFYYDHAAKIVPGETCAVGSSSISGMAFYPTSGGTFPAQYAGALFFTDHSRNCIWAMRAGAGGVPDPSLVSTFDAGAANPVDLKIGPDGALYYADFEGGAIRRITYGANQSPTAVIVANPTSGPVPLTVSFDGTGSSDPEGGALTYAWDLDGDGQFDDSTSASPSHQYNSEGQVTVGLRVTDPLGAIGTDIQLISVGAGGGGAAYRDLVLADGPASYWRLGEASGTAAADAMGLLGGTYTGGVALGGPGALTGDANTAAGLNGSTGYVAVGDHNRYSLATTGALTVEAWVKAATTPDIWAIVSKGSGNNYEWRLHRTEDTFGLTFWTADGSNRFSLDAPNGLFGSASAWYHVVATVQDGVAAKLYVNGVLRASTTTFAGASGNTASALNIGRRGDNRQYLAGSVDEVAVYDKVLTAAQVAAHYTAGTTGGGGGTNTPPVPTIATPATGFTWHVGETISFSGGATDAEDLSVPASRLSWSVVLQHCPSNCHPHGIQSFPGVAAGSLAAPDHEYPSYLELTLTATDSGGLQGSTTLRLDPETVVLSFASSPAGLGLAVNTTSDATPFTRTVIVGSANSISAPGTQVLAGVTYAFSAWSDGGAASHVITAPGAPATYTATYTETSGSGAAYRDLVLADGPASYWRLGEASGTAAADAMGLLGGTYTGGVALGGPGALTGDANTAAGLNGSTGYVAVGDHNRYSLATTGALTVEAWVKAATTPDIWAIVSKGSGNNYEWRLHRTEDTFGLTFWTADGSNRFSLDAPNGLFGSASAWYHVVATVQDGVAAKLYVNGVLRASTTTFAGASGNTASALNIGRRGDNRQYLAGSVDEVAVYDKVLTAAQVAAHYTAGTTGQP